MQVRVTHTYTHAQAISRNNLVCSFAQKNSNCILIRNIEVSLYRNI